MGIDAKYFSPSGVSLANIKDFLDKTYGGIVSDGTKDYDYGEKFMTVSGRLVFGKNRPRTVFAYVPGEVYEDDSPVNIIPGQSIFLISSATKKDIAILTSIAKNFGGYICENDCADEDSPGYWKYIESENPDAVNESELEGKIYQMFTQYMKDDDTIPSKNSPIVSFMTRFIKDNLDEIKKL